MECFVKIFIGIQVLNIFTKRFILDFWQGSAYTSAQEAVKIAFFKL